VTPLPLFKRLSFATTILMVVVALGVGMVVVALVAVMVVANGFFGLENANSDLPLLGFCNDWLLAANMLSKLKVEK